MSLPRQSTFAPRPGCPFCSIVSLSHPRSHIGGSTTPRRQDSDGLDTGSPSILVSSSDDNPVIFKDGSITAFVEKKYPISSKGHIILIVNLHVPSMYSLSSSDIPLLNHIQETASRLFLSLNPPHTPSSPAPVSPDEMASANKAPLAPADLPLHVGFITPPFKDNKIPIKDHLHAHAYLGTTDLAGWWRGTAYGYLAWYSVHDLIAEIREATSNNRIKTRSPNQSSAPIDLVPDAGSARGNADGSSVMSHANKTKPMSPRQMPNRPQVIITPEPRNLSSSAQLSAMGASGLRQSYGASVDLGTSFNVSPETPKASTSAWQGDRSDWEDAQAYVSDASERGPVPRLIG